jgi:hypothetical protein
MSRTFEEWMKEVRKHMSEQTEDCVEPSDIEDWGYWDAWNDGCTPKRAATLALKNAGWTRLSEVDHP